MLFSSVTFLLFFLPAVLVFYYALPNLTYKNCVLFLASLLFYAWGEPKFVFPMLASIVYNYNMGLFLGNDAARRNGRNGVHTKGADKRLPRALIFRDSFFTALEPFVSPLFSEAEYIWKQFQEEDKGLVLQYKPDIIIFEAVE